MGATKDNERLVLEVLREESGTFDGEGDCGSCFLDLLVEFVLVVTTTNDSTPY